MMKKLIPALLIAGGALAIYLLKNNKKEADEEKTMIKIDNGDDSQEDDCCCGTEVPTIPEIEDTETEYSDEVKEVNLLYPYLKPSMIQSVLEKNQEFSAAYEEGVLVNISHRICFDKVEDLIMFIKIIKEHAYQIEEAEGDHSITISRSVLVQDGSVISDILNVANQAICLNGQYKGWTIEAQ